MNIYIYILNSDNVKKSLYYDVCLVLILLDYFLLPQIKVTNTISNIYIYITALLIKYRILYYSRKRIAYKIC